MAIISTTFAQVFFFAGFSLIADPKRTGRGELLSNVVKAKTTTVSLGMFDERQKKWYTHSELKSIMYHASITFRTRFNVSMIEVHVHRCVCGCN